MSDNHFGRIMLDERNINLVAKHTGWSYEHLEAEMLKASMEGVVCTITITRREHEEIERHRDDRAIALANVRRRITAMADEYLVEHVMDVVKRNFD